MRTGIEASREIPITVSSGSGTGTLTKAWDLSRWFRVIPPAESNTYDVDIKDSSGHLMLKRTSQLGTMSELVDISLGIAATVNIANGSADGTYTAKFDLH